MSRSLGWIALAIAGTCLADIFSSCWRGAEVQRRVRPADHDDGAALHNFD